MPPEDPISEISRQWLTEARSDLALARIDKPTLVSWEALCFHAQQAAEKGLKAVLVHFQVDFPRTHSIGELIGLLEGHDHPVPADIQGADDGLPDHLHQGLPEAHESADPLAS